MKRSWFLIVMVIAITGLFVAGYFVRQRLNNPPLPSSGGGDNGGGLPDGTLPRIPPGGQGGSLPRQGLSVLGGDRVYDFFVYETDKAVLVRPDGQIVEIRGGQSSVLSGTTIANLVETAFSYDGKKILMAFQDPLAPELSVFDLQSKTWQPLAIKLWAFGWSPNDYRIAYLGEAGGRRAIFSLDLQDSKAKPKELLKLGVEDVLINWVAPNKILLTEKPSILTKGSGWVLDPQKKTLAQILIEKQGLQVIWDKDGSQGLAFGVSLEAGASLSLVDTQGRAVKRLSFVTVPTKCIFNSAVQMPSSTAATGTAGATPPGELRTLICGVPKNYQELEIKSFVDDYQKRAIFTSDNLYQINLSDGSVTTLLADSAKEADADKLRVFGRKLFFVNRLDQKLYSLPL